MIASEEDVPIAQIVREILAGEREKLTGYQAYHGEGLSWYNVALPIKTWEAIDRRNMVNHLT